MRIYSSPNSLKLPINLSILCWAVIMVMSHPVIASDRHHYGSHARHGSRYSGYSGHHKRYRNKFYARKYQIQTPPLLFPYRRYRKKYTGPHYYSIPARPHRRRYRGSLYQYLQSSPSAWNILAQGQYVSAFSLFAAQAQNHPYSGIPKAGYALSSAALGDLKRGVWAMRRAFRIAPDTFTRLDFNENNRVLIDTLIVEYDSQIIQKKEDRAFMLSALNYLRQDYLTARKAGADAEHLGDNSQSLINLQKLIDREFIEPETR